MSRPRLTIQKLVELVSSLAAPGPEWEWASRSPGDFPAVCRYCGDAVHIELIQDGVSVQVLVSHDVPLCAEAARLYEDVT